MESSVGLNQQNKEKLEEGKHNSMQLIAYALPHGAAMFLFIPAAGVLNGIYAKYFALELTAIALVNLVSRLFDAITDPAIGYLSDRSRMRFGGRKAWVILGSLGLIVSCYFLYVPPQDVTVFYFLCWTIVFYLAWTIIDIPHMAWGSEIAVDSIDRAKVFGFRTAFYYIGQILFYAVPFLPIFVSSEYTPETLKVSALLGGGLMLGAVIFMQVYIGNGALGAKILVEETRRKSESFQDIFRSIFLNKPLLICVATYFFAGIGIGMWFGLLFIYIDSYLLLGEKLAVIFLLGTTLALVATPIWLKIISWTNKVIAWGISTALYCVFILSFLLISSGDPNAFYLVLAACLGMYFCNACQFVVIPAVLSDTVDYGTWKFGQNRAATYFSFYTLISKINIGLGATIGLAVAGFFGFDPTQITHDENAVMGLRLAFIFIPVLFIFIGFIFVVITPIDERRHRIIRKRIDARIRLSVSRVG